MQEFKLRINDKIIESTEIVDVRNPYNNEVIAQVHRATKHHVDDCIKAGQIAYEFTKRQPSFKRSEILSKISNLIKERKRELADTIVSESGKPVRLAETEVDRAVETFKIASEEVMREYGELIPLDTAPASIGKVGLTKRFPIGICLGITPYNFPINLVAHKLAPCIAVGNVMIQRPSSECPVTSILLADICYESGLLPSALTVLPSKPEIAESLVIDDRIKKLSFTGSADLGWRLKSICGKKKITLELGGNAAAVLETDADLDFAVPRLAVGSFAYAGQICISVQRIYIQEKIYDDFVSRFLDYVQKSVKWGDPKDPDVLVGPIINDREIKRIESWLEDARLNGAKILCGNEKVENVISPTVLTDVRPDLDICCKEAFAPVVILTPYKDFEDALFMVNDSYYGLQASVFTKDVNKIFKAYQELEVGGVIINDYPTFRMDQMPYGGVKDSGFGREGIRYAMEEMTELKLLVLNQ
jgi:acyl-CoA reductase-like NAD-dependent aldehyde dehydrogenase